MGFSLTDAGATALSAGLGFVGNLGGSVASGLFNANQARINRKFQERMYNKQVEDNIKFWNMQNEYNLPSAQLQRIQDAGLNPLLLYGEGGLSGNLAQQQVQSGQAPHGAQASANFNSQIDMANLALVKAQSRLLNTEAEQKLQDIEESKSRQQNYMYDLYFKKLSQDLELSLKRGNLENVSQNTRLMSMQTLWHNELSFQNMLTLRQAREYEIKRYNLDVDYRGALVKQGWSNIANDTQRVRQGWRQLALFAQQVQNQTNLTNAQIGQIQWNVLQDKAMFLPRFRGLSLDNKLKVWDTHLKKADLTSTQVNTFNQMLKNFYLKNLGSETFNSYELPKYLWQSNHRPELQDMFVVPQIETKFNW